MSEPRDVEEREWIDADLCAHIAGLIVAPEINPERTLEKIATVMAQAGHVGVNFHKELA